MVGVGGWWVIGEALLAGPARSPPYLPPSRHRFVSYADLPDSAVPFATKYLAGCAFPTQLLI